MKILRTPDTCFENLENYPFAPHYTSIRTQDGAELRIHHIDEGPKDGPAVLCLHGEPAWSYVYRKMIPVLTAAGIRVIAPDLPGFGKSDKPASLEDYTYQSQVDWMNDWLAANDFTELTFFGQDWGGMIGLRVVADQPDRFDRVVISNTGLAYPRDVSEKELRAVEALKADPRTPTLQQMGRSLQGMAGESKVLKFATWQKFSWETENLPIGLIMYAGTSHDSRRSMAINVVLSKLGLGKIARSPVVKAYEAPYPDKSYKMGARAMPTHVPLLPGDPSTEAQLKAWAFFDAFEKPFLCAFSDDDPITGGQEAEFRKRVPGAQGQPHKTISGGGHFVQENAPEEISQTIINFIRATPAPNQ
ncbi:MULTISPECIES: haloalkane dehalogenase [Hyphobacterium]|uniref:Haloalkane dehalogenase n=1 Tax=Hyphobacterium vulgare TaxID=1736751 RepID=A0ABV7A0Z8_9PROT